MARDGTFAMFVGSWGTRAKDSLEGISGLDGGSTSRTAEIGTSGVGQRQVLEFYLKKHLVEIGALLLKVGDCTISGLVGLLAMGASTSTAREGTLSGRQLKLKEV
ncbi:hypothetical protein AMTR_s00001p00272950 [Amborella trichopoda]|uniref:Uncharacterized protein n=1 Tax=Amborella trichopoda TaxID=13333 RepID=W1NLL0_AMBTC|nr:hypothetical protein AMTR_s00001p00272950 [Amborella trichopoda]